MQNKFAIFPMLFEVVPDSAQNGHHNNSFQNDVLTQGEVDRALLVEPARAGLIDHDIRHPMNLHGTFRVSVVSYGLSQALPHWFWGCISSKPPEASVVLGN
jgi:hypothetical protein